MSGPSRVPDSLLTLPHLMNQRDNDTHRKSPNVFPCLELHTALERDPHLRGQMVLVAVKILGNMVLGISGSPFNDQIKELTPD
jgi:hypothetical protein